MNKWLNFPIQHAWVFALLILTIWAAWYVTGAIGRVAEKESARERGRRARMLSEAWDEYYRLAAHRTEIDLSNGTTSTVFALRGRVGTDGCLYLHGQNDPEITSGGAFCIAMPAMHFYRPGEWTAFRVYDGEGDLV